MPVIETRNLTKSYGKGDAKFIALDQVSLSIKKGESIAIIGKSGSGKSTLMHSLALLDKPTSGKVFVNDQDSGEMTGLELDLLRNKTYGFVFQQFFLNENDSVLNNVILPLKIGGISKKIRNEAGMNALKSVELDSKAQNRAGTLSGGQKQRACIARALINNPEIIFADEPTGNLDSTTGKNIEDLLFNLNKKQGITLIIVTHDEDIAKRCDRQLKIIDGKLIKGGEK